MIFKPFSELYLARVWRRSPGYVKEESTKMSSHLHPLRLEWQMLTFCPVCLCVVSCVWLFETLMDCSPSHSSVHEIFREEHWSELPFPLLGDLPDPGIWTHVSCVSCIGRQILYHWATWEVPFYVEGTQLLRLTCPFSILLCCLVLGFLIWIINWGERLSGHTQICLLSSDVCILWGIFM